MRKITLQKKLFGLFIIIFGMGTCTKGMELSDYLHPTTDDTIYLDPARRLPAEAAPDLGAFEFDVNSFNHP